MRLAVLVRLAGRVCCLLFGLLVVLCLLVCKYMCQISLKMRGDVEVTEITYFYGVAAKWSLYVPPV